jgi:hypothetical protein
MKELKLEPLEAEAAASMIAEIKPMLEAKNMDLNALDE